MKRREFVKKLSAVAGVSFVPCGLASAMGPEHAHHGEGARRQVLVGGKRMLTVDIHCHSYVHDVWPLIEDSEEIGYLRPLLATPLKDKIDLANMEFRMAHERYGQPDDPIHGILGPDGEPDPTQIVCRFDGSIATQPIEYEP